MSLNRYNEFKYAKEMLESGFQSKFLKYELKVLAKYYKFLGFKYKDIKENVYLFCEKYMKDFTRVKYFKMINSIVAYTKRANNNLIIIENIQITKGELEYIDSCDINEDYKTFLFSLLARYKLDKELYEYQNKKKYDKKTFSYKIKRHKDVFKSSKINKQKYKFDDVLHEFYKKGLIDVFDNGKLRLLFLDEMEKIENTDVAIDIDTVSMENVGFYWQKYKGNTRIKNCALCDIIIKVKNKRIYCEECSHYMQIASRRKTWHKHKEKYNYKK